jgi:hypothetical protein
MRSSPLGIAALVQETVAEYSADGWNGDGMKWNANNSSPVDRFVVLAHIEKCSPSLPAVERRTILNEVEMEVRQWSAYKRKADTFTVDVQLLIERLCREARDRRLHPLEKRMRQSRDEFGPVPLTRRELLRQTAEMALAPFPFEIERRDSDNRLDPVEGTVLWVDMTSLHPEKEFTFAKFDWSFLPTLKRLHGQLRLRDGRLYVLTTREVSIQGKRVPRFCPLISVIGAMKYGENFDSVFLTATAFNGNSLDLRAANVKIPALTQSEATREANEKFNEELILAGGANSPTLARLAIDELFARPTRVPVEQDKSSPNWVKSQTQELSDEYRELTKFENRVAPDVQSDEAVALAKRWKKKEAA